MNILIVDDTPCDLESLRAMLEAGGHTVLEAADGIDALAILEKEKIDAIISDILMPRMDGYRLCREVRAGRHFGELPFIIYTSSYTSAGDEKLALEMGADRFIRKPAPIKIIVDALRGINPAQRRPVGATHEADVMKEYNARLVVRLEEKNGELTVRNEELRVQRMESIGTLAGGIAHDLNNILSPIMLSIDLLKNMMEHPDGKIMLAELETSAKRGADIVRQVLSFARGMECRRMEIQPAALLKEIGHTVQDTFPGNIRLQVSVPSETWAILGDPTQIHQLLLNLCVNARDAMPDGGTLTIEAGNCVFDEQFIAMNLQANAGPYVIISVADTGTGIPQDIIDKIFEPFFTTKEMGESTGLGLSTVMAIVKSHCGFINVYSEPGAGTIFKVYLPAQTILRPQPEEAESGLPRGNGETILVVDDETAILTVTSQTLQSFGYRVLTANNGAEAVAIYAQHRREIDVVLTDMAMPVMDGPAMIHALLKIDSPIRIIAASGLNTNVSVAKAASAGVRHFLSKPYTAGTLLKTLRAVLDQA
jgi:CheY-like chemotaxis protein/nitrogen-specific signal transduction histidine kinase